MFVSDQSNLSAIEKRTSADLVIEEIEKFASDFEFVDPRSSSTLDEGGGYSGLISHQ